MAIVKNPFFSTFATGSVGKCLTCNPRYNENKFTIQKYKSRSGKRHEIQIFNAQLFKKRSLAMVKTRRILAEE